jgi:glyceraldehyde 3-phosphate dehydrogenase
MAVKIGINGFGRIGRLVLRNSLGDPAVQFVGINDVTDARTLAYLFKHDSVHGTCSAAVGAEEGALVVDGRKIRVTAQKDPAAIPWREMGAEVVLECSGKFTAREEAEKHLAAGASHVLISAPAKKPDLTVVMGVNHRLLDRARHRIISNASCTTNCLAPVAKVLDDNWGIVAGLMTTIHAYTNDQRILDQPHKDLRRARAAAMSMIPTSTGAAAAIGEVIPGLKGKLDGLAVRVPTPNVSMVDLAVVLGKSASDAAINAAMKAASEKGDLAGYLAYAGEPLVSIDFNGNRASSIFDPGLTKVTGGTLAKVMSWYDNESGYATRLSDLAKYLYGLA